MAHFKFLGVFCVLFCVATAQFRGNYAITASSVSTTAKTNNIKGHEEVSECACDLTSNSCDMSCCCDTDCPAQTLALWSTDSTSFCNSVVFEDHKPLTKCMKKSYLVYYNKRMGITIDDDESKDEICVTLDDRDTSATFYDEINFSSTADANTILDRWFGWVDSTPVYLAYSGANILYNYGDSIQRYDAARNIFTKLPIPSSNLLGGCDFNSNAVMGVSSSTTCMYKISSLSECTSILSPSTYAGYVISQYVSSTSVVSPTIAAGSASPATVTGADCANHLTNLKLTFRFQAPDAGFYIESVEVAYATSPTTLAVGDEVGLTVITEFLAVGDSVTQLSGNPGYIEDTRLLLATESSGAITQSGYMKQISAADGTCLTSGASLSTITRNYVKYNEDVNLQCNVAIADAAALQAQCTATAYQSYYMFNQFTKFGRYGDAVPSDASKWYNILEGTVTNSPTYDSATTTCQNMITGVEYKVLTSKIGYKDNLQSYIVGIKATPLQENFVFPGSATEIPYRVIFSNYVVLPSDIRDGEKISADFPPKVSNDIGSQAAASESSNSDDHV